MTQTQILEALPFAVYTTDAEGRITFFNEAAVELWGRRPELGSLWCGSWRLYWPDGRPMPHEECPMAVALKEGRAVRGAEAIAERPDGSRVPFAPYPTPLKGDAGRVTGAVNLLVDLSDRVERDIESARLAAIVENSDDAIVSKTLDGRITSWNAGATRIFGYEACEIVGRSIKTIVPPELHNEEDEILAKLKRGERLHHFDTVRVAKDGRRVDVSLTVSPLRDRLGRIVGASKVARDITQRKRSEKLERLMFDELRHRVKNTLAIVQAIATQSLRRASSPASFVESFSGRLQALASVHTLLSREQMEGADVSTLLREHVALGELDGSRIACSGPFVMLDARYALQVALVLHELATNARKYGALSVPTGRLLVTWRVERGAEQMLALNWRESGVRNLSAPSSRGFGMVLIERTIKANDGEVNMRFGADGLKCDIRLPIAEGAADAGGGARVEADDSAPDREPKLSDLAERRVLVIEDDPLIAIELESHLQSAGCRVIGPAGNVERAKRAIADNVCDAAILDANLGGRRVDELAAALAQKRIPFAVSTGYGSEALPRGYDKAPLLTKPFGRETLLETVRTLLAGRSGSPAVIPLRSAARRSSNDQ